MGAGGVYRARAEANTDVGNGMRGPQEWRGMQVEENEGEKRAKVASNVATLVRVYRVYRVSSGVWVGLCLALPRAAFSYRRPIDKLGRAVKAGGGG